MTPKDIANALNIPSDSDLSKFYGESTTTIPFKEDTDNVAKVKPVTKK